jgi:uncharacterized RDD family membrane protein YckC
MSDIPSASVSFPPEEGVATGLIASPLKESLLGAGFWIRALARVIDIGLHYVATFAALLPVIITIGIYSSITSKDSNRMIQGLDGFSFVAIAFSLIGAVSAHAICEGFHGSTLGKRICGLVVVSEDLSPCSFKAALGRSLAFYVDGLFFGAVGYSSMSNSPRKQRFGDTWNKTMVCRRTDISASTLRSGSRLFWVFLFGFSVDASFLAIGLTWQVFW